MDTDIKFNPLNFYLTGLIHQKNRLHSIRFLQSKCRYKFPRSYGRAFHISRILRPLVKVVPTNCVVCTGTSMLES